MVLKLSKERMIDLYSLNSIVLEKRVGEQLINLHGDEYKMSHNDFQELIGARRSKRYYHEIMKVPLNYLIKFLIFQPF